MCEPPGQRGIDAVNLSGPLAPLTKTCVNLPGLRRGNLRSGRSASKASDRFRDRSSRRSHRLSGSAKTMRTSLSILSESVPAYLKMGLAAAVPEALVGEALGHGAHDGGEFDR